MTEYLSPTAGPRRKTVRLPVDADLSPEAVEYAVEVFERENGQPPAVLIAEDHEENLPAFTAARASGIGVVALPIEMGDSWAVADGGGNMVWSSGA